mmetsp:Transcript_3110/g.8229  ORF Transcript_3110/g.8229 Transcript_3110/m.8229 type:complete len:244 (-) Transcript_3110:345-1076(-)
MIGLFGGFHLPNTDALRHGETMPHSTTCRVHGVKGLLATAPLMDHSWTKWTAIPRILPSSNIPEYPARQQRVAGPAAHATQSAPRSLLSSSLLGLHPHPRVEPFVCLNALAVQAVARVHARDRVGAARGGAQALQLVVVDERVGEVGVRDIHLPHVGTDEVGTLKDGAAHVRAAQESVVEECAGCIYPPKIGLVEDGSAEDSPAQIRTVEVSLFQTSLRKQRLREILPRVVGAIAVGLALLDY